MKITSTMKLVAFATMLVPAFADISASSNGLPAGYKKPGSAPRTKTDFDAIYSAIEKKANSAKFMPSRDISERDSNPPNPPSFQLVFGPLTAANNAVGYMGYVFLNSYDVNACASACNSRPYDATSGPCIFFNIYTGTINNVLVVENVCSMYNTVTDASTALNFGAPDQKLTLSASRGYSRINAIQDGSFQDYTCILQPGGNACPFVPSAFWNRFVGVSYDFLLVNNNPAHSGTSSVLLDYLPDQVDNPPPDQPSTLTYIPRINTVAGKTYMLSVFYTPNSLTASGQDPLFSMLWNGVKVLNVMQPANATVDQSFTFFNAQTFVTATGNDTLTLQNGALNPHSSYVDDIAVFQKWT